MYLKHSACISVILWLLNNTLKKMGSIFNPYKSRYYAINISIMKIKILIWSFLLTIALGASLLACGGARPKHDDLRVVLIRHGEKPDNGDNLSCAGFNRSLKLPAVLQSKYGIPNAIFVPSPGTGKQTKNCRMLQTIIPFAIKNNVTINTTCAVDESDRLAKAIKKESGTVFVVWEHNELPTIAGLLGVSGKLKWSDSDFDGIWVITFHKGKATLTQDKEGIKPADTCPF